MIKGISHIGIAVKDLRSAADTYRKLLNTEPSPVEFVEGQKVNVVKFKVGNSTIELLEGSSPDSAISRFIEKRGEGIHHIAFESDNVADELARIAENGFELINKEPVTGSDNMQIAFIKPASTTGVLTEICQH